MFSNQALLMWFLEIILLYNSLAVEGICIEAYRGTRTKKNKTLRQIGHSTSIMVDQSFSDKTISAWNGLTFVESPALAEFKYKLLS